jgi:NTP pyrophosphatase (non-canonical NTP hydrolase)
VNFTEYQKRTRDTAVYPELGCAVYPALGLAGEAGEVADNIKKALRDDGGVITPDRLDALEKELGDVLWYVAAVCTDVGLSMDLIALANLRKLEQRALTGSLHGSGDDR